MGESFDSATQIIAYLMYIWINWLVIVFAIAYFKRFFWTCILVIFAPVMATMYAFGQQTKQIYSNWLKEFILNAFVQPFHLVVYTVLITLPMEIANGDSWTWSWSRGPEMTYCLMAMSMIRPAEKYLRRLFQMDKGIANMASYDSGKQTITDIGKAVAQVAKTAAAVYTGGATAMAGAALGSNGLDNAGKSLTEAGDSLGKLKQGDEGTPEWIADGWDRDSQGRYFDPYKEEWFTEEELYSGRDLPAYMDQDDFSEADMMTLTDGIKNSITNSDNEQSEEIIENPNEFMKTLRNGSEAKDENMTDDEVAKAVGSESVAKMLEDAGFSQDQISAYLGDGVLAGEGGQIDGMAEELSDFIKTLREGSEAKDENMTDDEVAKAVGSENIASMLRDAGYDDEQISAYLNNRASNGQVEEIAESPKEFMKTLRENSESKEGNMTDDEVAKSVGSKNIASMLEDAGFSEEQISSYLGIEKEGAGSGNINANNVTINASSVNMEKGDNIKLDASVETTNEITDNSSNNDNKTEVADVGEITLDVGETEEASSKSEQQGNFMEVFTNLGGLEQVGNLANDIIDGVHSISSGLYIDGAPQEWGANSKWRRENIAEAGKKREEDSKRNADNWANNKANINVMQNKYYEEELEKALNKYAKKDSSGNIIGYTKEIGYIESVAQEQAKTKAKAALKDMSAYVQYGVTDVNLAYDLYKNANDNGFSPEQSIKDYAPYHQFNKSAANINTINVSPNFPRNDYESVEQAIPNAKTYYDAGYTDLKDMAWVEYMADRLGKSPEFAMKVDEALKKKGKGGKLSYNGKDAEMKKVIDQINSHY